MNKDHEHGNCPMCNGPFTENEQVDKFPVGKDGVVATALVPVVSCANCDFSFTDSRAEQARHDAACVALNLLTPGQIKEIRSKYGMNLREFATAFQIGHASLERWESRKLFVGGQSNYYLRALADVSVGQRLLQGASPNAEAILQEAGSNVVAVDFRALRGRDRLRKAESRDRRFNLKRANA